MKGTCAEIYDNLEYYFNNITKFNLLGYDIERSEFYEYGQETAVYSFEHKLGIYSFTRDENEKLDFVLIDLNKEVKKLIRKKKINKLLNDIQ